MDAEARQAVHSDQDLLVRYLARKKARCPGCRSNLTAVASAECPVCGVPLELFVRTQEPYLRAWATLTVALGLSGGVGLILILGIIAWGMPFDADEPLGTAAMVFHVASVPLGIAVSLWRRRFVKQPPGRQWLVAIVATAAAAAAFVTLFALLLMQSL